MLGLVDGVCHNDFVQCAGVDTINRISAEDTVGDQRIHLRSALLLQELRSASDGVRSVRQVVDQNGRAVCDVSYKHHSRILPVVDLRGSTLLVDEREWHAECIGDGSRSLCASGVWTDDNGLLVVGDVGLNVLAQKVATVEVVNGNVEETLVLGV